MLSKSHPILGSFDVLQLSPVGNNPSTVMPGVFETKYPLFCTLDEANTLAAEINKLLVQYGATASVSEDMEEAALFIFMKNGGPRLYRVTASFTREENGVSVSYTVDESAGELLNRQTHPSPGIDKFPYAVPTNPSLCLVPSNGTAQFFWS